MDDIEKRKLYNKCGIDESIDLSDIVDGEIRPLDVSQIQKANQPKNKNKKKKEKENFTNYLLNCIEKTSNVIDKIKNSKNPEMLIIINVIFGIFFHLLSDPPILPWQTNYYFINEITDYLRNSIFFIFMTAFFFALAYLQIFFIRKEFNNCLLVMPLIIQFFLFIFSDNEINDKINFGIYRKFVLFTSTVFFFFIGLFLKYLKDFLQRKSLNIKITVFIFYFTLFIYLNILTKATCDKDRIFLDENNIDDSIGCNTDYENYSCFARIIDDLFDLGNFISKDYLISKDKTLDNIYFSKINEIQPISNYDTYSYNNSSQLDINVSTSNKNNYEESIKSKKFSGKKIYSFPDFKNIFSNYILKTMNEDNYNKELKTDKEQSNDSVGFNSTADLTLVEKINPYNLIDAFLNNIVDIDTGIHIEINMDSKQNKENRSFLTINNLEVKNPVNSYSDRNLIFNERKLETDSVQIDRNTIEKKLYNEFIGESENYNKSKIDIDKNNKTKLNETTLNIDLKDSDTYQKFSENFKNEENDNSKNIYEHEIYYDNRDMNKPFININPQANEKIKEKIERNNQIETPNTIVLLEFDNLSRVKFKTKFPFVYSFLKRFYKLSFKNHDLDLNNLSEQEKISYQSKLNQSLQAFQFMKFFQKPSNFSKQKKSKKMENLIDKMNKLGYLTMFAAADLNLNEIKFDSITNSFNKLDKQISKSFYGILTSYDKIILQKLYSKFEESIIKRNEGDNRILANNNNIMLDYAAKFISQFSSSDKFIHLKFDQANYMKDTDKELVLWLKNIKKLLENKKFILIFYSNTAEEKPFYVSEFTDFYNEEIERKSLMLFKIFPTNKFNPKFLEMVKSNQNFPICDCDFYNMLDFIISGKDAKINEKLITFKDLKKGILVNLIN